MSVIHNLGFPRIGARRELKFALEAFWRGDLNEAQLSDKAATLRTLNRERQQDLDLIQVGDFSFYDQVLDMSVTLGNLPTRVLQTEGGELERYFRAARGRAAGDTACQCVHAGEMTKWFDTNYHYIVPEFDRSTRFSLNSDRLVQQLRELGAEDTPVKVVVLGPLTYLALGKSKDETQPLQLLPGLLEVYGELLTELAAEGVEWVQIDEPALVTDLDNDWQQAYRQAYQQLASASGIKLLLTTYFGALEDNLALACSLPVAGIHLDAVKAPQEVQVLINHARPGQVISLGVVDGRNIWRTDLEALLDWLEPVSRQLGERLWLAPSCSLLHVPVDLALEQELDAEIRSWLAFAQQKLDELKLIQRALREGRSAVADALLENQVALQNRRASARVRNPQVRAAVAAMEPSLGQRQSPYAERAKLQHARLRLPLYPTTTIGSFPQTDQLRQLRRAVRQGEIDESTYRGAIKQEIERCIEQQEALGLDVLVHGEAERNDMVEYFGQQLDGYTFSRFGWVQSYGSRCVKPPILFGDISRPKAMTVEWIQYAQSLTKKPMKGMLTGPVTILNWSFVRDDQPLEATAYQLALAIRQEVQDLEAAGIDIIQIDEAALREGLPLRKSQWQSYLDWAVEAFRISANGVADSTQIHTHMCYSEFNDILPAIARMDADVITIETSRSDMELLDAFETFSYPNEIGPGVYDIHSPNVPSEASVYALMQRAAERIPAQRLWVNPDCGLKTRQWSEVIPALRNMVAAAHRLRAEAG